MSRPGTFDRESGEHFAGNNCCIRSPLQAASRKSERIGWRQIGRNDLRERNGVHSTNCPEATR